MKERAGVDPRLELDVEERVRRDRKLTEAYTGMYREGAGSAAAMERREEVDEPQGVDPATVAIGGLRVLGDTVERRERRSATYF